MLTLEGKKINIQQRVCFSKLNFFLTKCNEVVTMEEENVKVLPFHEMGLDDRLLKAIAKLGWSEPTLIQEKAIPLILEGRDLLARGRTGSGKTGAFAIPTLQKILNSKKSSKEQNIKVLMLAPSRELVKQIYNNILELTASCGRVIRCVDLSSQVDIESQKPLLLDLPDIVIGTPTRVLAHLQAGNMVLKGSMETLVIDEADLIFSFGCEKDLKGILSRLPSIYQAILSSATLSDDVNKLKKLVLHNAVTLKLEEPQLPDTNQLTQYQIKIEEEDKFVLIYALFKLRLIQGKTIIFVNNVDRCYKIKLYLEQFQIPVCVLNSELPVSTRCHIVGQFNQGIYEIIVASDERFFDADANEGKKVDLDKQRSQRKKDKESGVARGIDFQFVSNVINFDFPHDVESYIHRVGRTARGNNQGTALSFISGKEIERLAEVENHLKDQIGVSKDSEDYVFKPYKFKMDELDGFRYRARDAWRAVTKIAIREARLKEIKHELLNSSKLQAHFHDNPRDALVLRHDKALHTVKHQTHLRNVPDYIVPGALKKVKSVKYNKKNRNQSNNPRTSQAKKNFRKRMCDPLRTVRK